MPTQTPPPQADAPLAIGQPLDRAAQKKRLMWQLGTLVLVSCAAALTGMAFDRQMQNLLPETHSQPSVFNHKPSGTSGALEIAQKAGLACKEWVLPYRQLNSIAGVLVIISPSESLADFESEQILNWVKKGNELVYFDHFSYKITRHLLTRINVDAKDGESLTDAKIVPKATSPLFQHVNDLIVSADTRLTGTPGLVEDKAGTLFAELKHGKGRILLGTAPSLVSNRRLATEDAWPNFQFFINWLTTAGGEIWFDERCHGFSNNSNVFIFLARGASGATVMQLLFILCIGIISASQRFGRTAQLHNKRRLSNLEFIFGLSNAYKRAKANTAVLEILGQALRTKLCKALQINPHETTEHVLEAWRSSPLAGAKTKQAVERFLTDYDSALQRRNLSEAELKSM
ncbi:MAG: DUF4350 domain-containing protein, partial [Terriglobales bacterium]